MNPSRLWASPALLLVVTTLCWSGNFVVGRAVHTSVPPIALAFWRWTIALLLVIGFAAPHLRRDLAALRKSGREVLLLSILGVATFNTLVYLGLRTTTVINGVLLQSTMPLVILLGSFLLFRERVQARQMVAIGISLAGVALIVARGSWETLAHLSLAPGDGWIFLAVCCYAIYSLRLRFRPAVHPLCFLSVTFALGSLLLLPLFLWEHFSLHPFHPGPTALAAIAYVGVFPSLIAYLCFNRAVELIGPNRAGQFLHLMPVFGSILAALFLGERLRIYHFGGAVLIGAGIVLANYSRR